MIDLINTVELFLKKYELEKEKNILIGFSGGVDSMCLADVMAKLRNKFGFNLILIHLNHNWRGKESLLEEQNAQKFANKKNIKFYSETLPENTKHTETIARELRYKFFEKCSEKFNSKCILTAHNLNDNVETVLYRISYGTGIQGLCGIKEKREIYYRPLLNVSRAEIEEYNIINNLNPNQDSSNENIKYKRNLIRKNILPELSKINPNICITVNNLIKNTISESEIVDEYINKLLKDLKCKNYFLTNKFTNLSKNVKMKLIYKLFKNYGLDYDFEKIERIANFIEDNKFLKNGKTKSLTKDLWIFVNFEKIEIIKRNETLKLNTRIIIEGKYEIDEKTFFEILPYKNELKEFPKDKEMIAYADLSKVKFDFILRSRNYGDLIQPLGCNGTQKLKKYINSKKIPKYERDNIILLAQGSEVLWVAGFGLSEKIKVAKNPTHVLKLYNI